MLNNCSIIDWSPKLSLEAILGELFDLAEESGFDVAKSSFERFNITIFQVAEIK